MGKLWFVIEIAFVAVMREAVTVVPLNVKFALPAATLLAFL
jgi:hypothetical protein